MKRFFGFILIGMGILVALLTIGNLLWPTWDFKSNFGNGSQSDQETLSFPLDKITELELNTSSIPVTVTETEADQIALQLTTGGRNSATLHSTQHGGRLVVTVHQPSVYFNLFGLFSGRHPKELHVTIPKEYRESLDIRSSSGAVNLTGLDGLDQLSINVSSGSVRIEQVNAKSFQFNGSSGQLMANHLDARKNDIRISSGRINIERLDQ